ncbi:Maf family nucleotide pyrophosphatase [Gilvimarinus sp. SDUM040013]|uniref:7-methyl-GTP pyrophosphatase n=1 Tax=Gilvimarinus gilvus TaxID=3058038 RepID=A0ABU4RXG9_9GAMM|nr:Maf family nucleotide pyrophosphatase [Gilvimarinus sp. SDUM040013]MDO3385725.1 Maf family nucleotide pyrophosphatase [Gilvimarinus sp. SDUM040013]MDX6849364.1 Maf family nucleotide pyrophosphatase [Gilvimarinus sp. SDUM040013]
MSQPHIVLASSSPYRAQLLERLGIPFVTQSPNIDESPQQQELPERLALRLASNKARAIAASFPKSLIIGSDQVASLDGGTIGKPGGYDQAFKQLSSARGQWLTFHTGLSVYNAATNQEYRTVERYRVKFRSLSDQQIDGYLRHDQPYDCAGSFKCEKLGIALFEQMDGRDPNSLIGLPLIALVELLAQAGLDVLLHARPA